MIRLLESVLIFLVRNVPLKGIYSIAWRLSQSVVLRRPAQARVATSRLGFQIQGELDDYLFRSIYFKGTYEPEIFAVLSKLVKKDQLWLDLGSNIGYFSLYFASRARKVISIDANPKMASLLTDTMQLNHFRNFEVLNRAVSDSSGKQIEFFISDADLGRSSAIQYADLPDTRKVTVETTTIDEVLGARSETAFGMKIDIEGLELFALRGGAGVLQKNPPKVIVMELSQREGIIASPQEIMNFLQNYGYVPHVIRSDQLLPVKAAIELDIHLDPNAFFLHQSFSSSSIIRA
jgi:FkbM family methyltransferase